MNTLSSEISTSDAGVTIDHLALAKEWLDDTSYPMTDDSQFHYIGTQNGIISFWHGDILCSCPCRKREEGDVVSIEWWKGGIIPNLRVSVQQKLSGIIPQTWEFKETYASIDFLWS